LSIIVGMDLPLAAIAPARDRRVRRTRATLMRAAVELVSERGTATVPLSDIAAAADVSRQVVYQQFGDRETLFLETALDLCRRELLPGIGDARSSRDRVLAWASHFADHREFYRAILTSASAFALNRALSELFIPLNREVIHRRYGKLDPPAADDLAMFVTGGWAAFINAWVVDGPTPLDPEEFTDRLLRMLAVLLAHDKEQHR
jgi:AcrR family transcriptional regulator